MEEPGQDSTTALATELRIVVSKLVRRLREQSNLGDLSWSHISVLTRLDRDGPASVTDLARSEGVRPQSMGATVSALEAAGMVVGEADPADGRRTILSLTRACRDLINANRAAREDWLFHALEAKLSADEQRDLTSALELLKRLAES